MRNAILMGATQLKSIKNTRTHIRCKYITRTRRICHLVYVSSHLFVINLSWFNSVFSIHVQYSVFFRLALCYKLVALHIINNYGIINICVTYCLLLFQVCCYIEHKSL